MSKAAVPVYAASVQFRVSAKLWVIVFAVFSTPAATFLVLSKAAIPAAARDVLIRAPLPIDEALASEAMWTFHHYVVTAYSVTVYLSLRAA